MSNITAVYERAVEKWHRLRVEGQYSAPVHTGEVAVICSHWSRLSGSEKRQEIEEIDAAGQSIVDNLRLLGRRTTLVTNASFSDVTAAVSDWGISDIHTVSHGNLSSIAFRSPLLGYYYDWRNVSVDTTHLKTGTWNQWSCGRHARMLSVPLGMFALADPRNVLAADEKFITPQDILRLGDALLRPIIDVSEPPDANWIYQRFKHEPSQDLPELIMGSYVSDQ